MASGEGGNYLPTTTAGLVQGPFERDLEREPVTQLHCPQTSEGLINEDQEQPFALSQKDTEIIKRPESELRKTCCLLDD